MGKNIKLYLTVYTPGCEECNFIRLFDEKAELASIIMSLSKKRKRDDVPLSCDQCEYKGRDIYWPLY